MVSKNDLGLVIQTQRQKKTHTRTHEQQQYLQKKIATFKNLA